MRDVFIGTAAYLGRITGESTCSFWPTDPRDLNWDAKKLVDVDLALTNAAAAERGYAGPIHCEAIKTTLGPRWPRGPQFVGRVYLHEAYHASLTDDIRPPNPPRDVSARDYEYWLIVYRLKSGDPREGRRYQGVHAEVVTRNGTRAEIDVLEPGKSLAFDCERKRISLDLASLDVCDAPKVCAPAIGADPAVKQGPLFLAEGRAFEVFRSTPKTPIFLAS